MGNNYPLETKHYKLGNINFFLFARINIMNDHPDAHAKRLSWGKEWELTIGEGYYYEKKRKEKK
jgi:hypothetical protein